MQNQVQITDASDLRVWSDTARESPDSGNAIDTVSALQRHWALVTTVTAGATVLAYLLCQLVTPLFAAKTSVMIEARSPSPAASLSNQMAMQPSEETLRKNEISILRSRSLAESVVTRLSLDRDPEFNPTLQPTKSQHELLVRAKAAFVSISKIFGFAERRGRSEEDAREDTVDIFLDRLGVTSTDASRVIDVRFLSETPDRAAQVANTIVNEYIAAKIHQQIAGPQTAAESLERHIQALNKKIRDSERVIDDARKTNGLLPTEKARVLVDQLSELNKRLAVVTGERMTAEARLKELHSTQSGRAESAAAVLASALIQRLQAEASLLASRIGQMSTTYGEQNPKLAQARAELAELHARIDAEVAKIAASYRDALLVAKANETSLRQEVEWLKTQVAKADSSEVDVRALERGTEADKGLMMQLVTHLNETKAHIELQGAEAWVISKATVPRLPSFPPKLAIVAAALLFSAMGGAILAVLLERRDGAVRSMEQIRRLTAARVFGALPLLKLLRRDGLPQSERLEKSLFAENLRGFWFQLNKIRSVPAKTLLITSSVSSEGKSTISACLARIIAWTGGRVVVVDADLRNPTAHRLHCVDRSSPGLAELIAGKVELDQVLQFDSTSSTFVITAGTCAASPSDILRSPRLSFVLRELAKDFDAVIIDSPPVLAAHDACILAQEVDTAIMVVRWGETKATALRSALQRMSDCEVDFEGIILSMVDVRKYQRYGSSDAEVFSRGSRKYYLYD